MRNPLFWLLCFVLLAYPFLLRGSCPKQRPVTQKIIIAERVLSSEVTITAYALTPGQTDGDPHITATMTSPVPGKTCAISRDLARAGWLGHLIWIEGYGVWKANDVMAPRWKKRVDLCLGKKEAQQFGVKKSWAVVIE